MKIDRKKLKTEMARKLVRDIYYTFEPDSAFHALLSKIDSKNPLSKMLSLTDIEILMEELENLKFDLLEYQTLLDVNKKFSFWFDPTESKWKMVDEFDYETVGAWKTRLSQMEKSYQFDEGAVKIIKNFRHKLFDRNSEEFKKLTTIK